MSTGWIKMGTGLRDHPKVVRMARLMAGGAEGKAVTKQDRMKIVGALHAVWSVFDEHSPDGHLEGYSLSIMDEEIGWKGFCRAMQAVGWLIEDADGLVAPDYEEHNGATAKRRASETKRKAGSRSTEGRQPSASDADARAAKLTNLSASDADKEHRFVRTDCGHVSASDADNLRVRIDKSKRNTSVAIATDAAASSAGPPDPKPKLRTPDDEAKAETWRAAIAVLREGGCPSEAVARTFMGKLARDFGFPVVREAVAAVAVAQPADAREYLLATCRRLKGERGAPVADLADLFRRGAA